MAHLQGEQEAEAAKSRTAGADAGRTAVTLCIRYQQISARFGNI
ncbi:hypothetical protein [Xanthomonas sp.]|nr:hypothetical protein [Xanthomonas sp.]